MQMIGQKNVNSVKTTLYYGAKKSTGCPFFPISHEKSVAHVIFFMLVGLEVKLFLQNFWISTIYAWLEALAHMFCNFNRL